MGRCRKQPACQLYSEGSCRDAGAGPPAKQLTSEDDLICKMCIAVHNSRWRYWRDVQLRWLSHKNKVSRNPKAMPVVLVNKNNNY